MHGRCISFYRVLKRYCAAPSTGFVCQESNWKFFLNMALYFSAFMPEIDLQVITGHPTPPRRPVQEHQMFDWLGFALKQQIKATKVLIIQVTWRYSSRRLEGTFAGHLFIKLREKKHLWNLSGPEVVSWSTAEQGKSFNQVNQDHFKQLKQY